jgi:O-antigen/teichoic acid export membrane protein
LSVFRVVRYIVPLNVLAILVNIGANLVLIPRHGALGAAIGTSGTLVAHNLLKQAALKRTTGLSFFDARYIAIYAMIGLGFAGVFVWTRFVTSDLVLQLPIAAAVCIAVVALSLRRLAVLETFPELARLLAPVRALFGGTHPSPGGRPD